MKLAYIITGIIAIIGIYIGYSCMDRFDIALVKGKNVLVTGASTGIGEQIAYHYAKMGANVVITARRESRLQEVIAKCKEMGDPKGTYSYIAADMSDKNAYENVIKTAVSRLGGLDYLVLNHIMYSELGPWLGTHDNLTQLGNQFDINFQAYVHLASHAMPALENSGGSIMVVSSVGGKMAIPYSAGYSASKFALDGFFSSLRQELTIRGVPVSITLCIVALTRTEKAIKHIEDFGLKSLLDKVTISEPSDVALSIIKGGALRQREMYATKDGMMAVLFRDWFTQIVEKMMRDIYTKP